MSTFYIKIMVMTATLLSAAEFASAQSSPRGTPEDQRACNLDVRQHCREVMSQGDMAILACLRQHRANLTRACESVLRKNGQ
jgi:hypothetical protein